MIKFVIPLCLFTILIFTFCEAPQDYSLTDADVEYFENLLPGIGEAWNDGDREPYIKLNENSMYMIPNSQALSTPEDIRSFVEGFPECMTEYSDFDISGNQGLVGVRGRYLINQMNGELMDKGKFIALFEKNESEEWELTQTIWNSDLPVAVQEENSENENSE